MTYNWTQTNGPIVKLNQNTYSNLNFVAPLTTEDTKLTFEMIVTNSNGIHSHPSFVSITVHPSPPVNKMENSITNIIKELVRNHSANGGLGGIDNNMITSLKNSIQNMRSN